MLDVDGTVSWLFERYCSSSYCCLDLFNDVDVCDNNHSACAACTLDASVVARYSLTVLLFCDLYYVIKIWLLLLYVILLPDTVTAMLSVDILLLPHNVIAVTPAVSSVVIWIGKF